MSIKPAADAFLKDLKTFPLPKDITTLRLGWEENSLYAIVLGTESISRFFLKTIVLPKPTEKSMNFSANRLPSTSYITTSEHYLTALKTVTAATSDADKQAIANVQYVLNQYLTQYKKSALSLTQPSIVSRATCALASATWKLTKVAVVVAAVLGAGMVAHSKTCSNSDWAKTCRTGEKAIVGAVNTYVSPDAAKWLKRDWTQLARGTATDFVSFVNSFFN